MVSSCTRVRLTPLLFFNTHHDFIVVLKLRVESLPLAYFYVLNTNFNLCYDDGVLEAPIQPLRPYSLTACSLLYTHIYNLCYLTLSIYFLITICSSYLIRFTNYLRWNGLKESPVFNIPKKCTLICLSNNKCFTYNICNKNILQFFIPSHFPI